MAADYKWDEPQRQPPAAIVVVIFKSFITIIKMLWPALLAIVFSQRKEGKAEKWIIISGIAVAAGLIYAVFEFFFFRFLITGNELVVKKGFFNKREIVLPLARIQAVHLDQDWLHRLLNIVKVSVDSPGASNAEVKFSLNKTTAEAFRAYISREAGQQTEEGSAVSNNSVPVFALNGTDLFKLGISANFLKAFLLLLAFFVSVLDNLDGITGKKSGDWVMWVGDQASQSSVSLIAITALIVLIVSVLASFVMVVLKYGGFRIERITNGFHIKTGLLNRKEKIVPFKRVQYISWKANWIRRHIPYYLLQYHAIGEKDSKEKWDISVPVTQFSFFDVLLHHYHELLPEGKPEIRIQPAYVLRRLIFAALICTVVFGVLYIPFGLYSLWVFLAFPVATVSSWIFQRKFKARVSNSAIQVHREVFGKTYILLRWDKIQSVTVKQSIFQRRKNLATLKLFTAGGTVVLPFIKLNEANEVRDFAIYKVETQSFPQEAIANP